MRLAAPFMLWLAAAAPAAGQVCEASISGKPGEVIATLDSGARGPVSVMWSVERREGVGEETDHFARPGLMLDFSVAGGGGGLVPSRAVVSVTRYSDPELGRAPEMSEVSVRATPKGSGVIVWIGNEPAKGEAALVKRLKEVWPDELAVEVVAAGGDVLAGSVFDLSVLPDVRAMARQAAAKCGR